MFGQQRGRVETSVRVADTHPASFGNEAEVYRGSQTVWSVRKIQGSIVSALVSRGREVCDDPRFDMKSPGEASDSQRHKVTEKLFE